MILVTLYSIYYQDVDEMDSVFQWQVKAGKIARLSFLILFLASIVFINTDVYAAIPLITDDTGTQGKGKFQVEIFSGNIAKTGKGTSLSTTFTYGIIDQVDIVLSVPYQFLRAEDDEATEGPPIISILSPQKK